MDNLSAIIRITNLRLRTFVGFNPEERSKQQDVVINVEIHHTAAAAALQDDVSQALDYKAVSKAIIRHVESGRFLLLEKLTADLLAICTSNPAVTRARVTVDKPHALRFADSVSFTLEFDRKDNQLFNEDSHEHYHRSLSQAS